MKRVILGLAVLALLAIPVGTSADVPPTKVDVCHVNSANKAGLIFFPDAVFGRVISVTVGAKNAHVRHGDVDAFQSLRLDADLRDVFAELFEVRLPNASCLIF